MPTRARVDEFIAVVVSGRHDEAIELFYTEDASMQENLTPPRVGRDNLVARERATMARFVKIDTEVVGPVFIEGDAVVINWIFTFTASDGKSFSIDELAYQHWAGDLIHRERFYYDPKQFASSS
jgi:hypothetical protein